MPWTKTSNNSPVTYDSDSLTSSLASLVVKGSGGGENKRKVAPYSDVVSALSSLSISALFLIYSFFNVAYDHRIDRCGGWSS